MTLAIRFLPNPGRKVIYGAGGRAYPSTGATVDIPFPDAETIQSDQATRLMIIGATADRPVDVPRRINWPPREMYDTTLGAPHLLGSRLEPCQMGKHNGHCSLRGLAPVSRRWGKHRQRRYQVHRRDWSMAIDPQPTRRLQLSSTLSSADWPRCPPNDRG